jgi:hypothetical protein
VLCCSTVPWEESRLGLGVLMMAETREDAALECLNFDEIKSTRLERCEEKCMERALMIDTSNGYSAHVARGRSGRSGAVKDP